MVDLIERAANGIAQVRFMDYVVSDDDDSGLINAYPYGKNKNGFGSFYLTSEEFEELKKRFPELEYVGNPNYVASLEEADAKLAEQEKELRVKETLCEEPTRDTFKYLLSGEQVSVLVTTPLLKYHDIAGLQRHVSKLASIAARIIYSAESGYKDIPAEKVVEAMREAVNVGAKAFVDYLHAYLDENE